MVIILSAGDATPPLRRRLLVMLRKRAVVVLLLQLLLEIVGKHSGRRDAGERERERERDAVRLSVLDDPAHWSSPAASREPAIITCLA